MSFCFWNAKVSWVLLFVYIFSQLGYLLAIPRSPDMKEEQDFAIDGLEFVVIITSLVQCLSNILGSSFVNERLTNQFFVLVS